MRLPRRRLIALAAAALPLRSADAARDLRVLVPELPKVLDPHLALTPLDRTVASACFLGLVMRDAAGAVVPALAESWTESSDGNTYTFALRRDLRWSDGSVLNAQDVVFSLQRALNPATAAPFASTLGRIAKNGVTAPDRNTVRIVLTLRSTRFLEALTHPIAAVVPRAVISKQGSGWIAGPRPVCSGPFQPAEGARLARNPNAVIPPLADAVQFEMAESFETATDRIHRGDGDITLGFAPEPIADRTLQRQLRFDRGQSIAFVAVNLTRPKLRTREIRHGLGMMIDREKLLRSLRIPNATAVYAPVPLDVHTAPAPHPAPYQQIKADDRRVIAQVLLQEESIAPATPATFRFLHPSGHVPAAIAAALAEAWAKLGVRLEIESRSSVDYINALMAGDFDLALATSRETGQSSWPYIASFAKSAGPDNLPHYADDDFETPMETAAISLDANGMSIAIGNAEGVLAEDQIVLPLFAFRAGYPVGNALNGWESTATGIHPLHLIAPHT